MYMLQNAYSKFKLDIFWYFKKGIPEKKNTFELGYDIEPNSIKSVELQVLK